MTNAWHVLVTYASGFEADLAIARLESAEIPAMRDSNDTVGIFVPSFQGATATSPLIVHVADVAMAHEVDDERSDG